MRFFVPWVAVAALVSVARADPVSVRCAAGQNNDAYFVTYDIQTSRFMVENPAGRLSTGEITSATDQRLALRLNAMNGPVPLSFDRQAKLMQWPGIPARQFSAAPLIHNCTTTTDRTVLSLFGGSLQRRTPVDAFSIRCHGASLDFFITMDRSTRAVVMETEAGTSFSGEISGNDGAKLTFSVGAAGATVFSGTWDEQTQELTGNDPSHPPHSQHCIAEKSRSIMAVYDKFH